MIKYTDPPQSRNEEILKATINGTSYDKEPQSRIEDLLLELKAAIEGGGGGGTTNYNNLENRPQINSHTLEGDMSFEDLGIDETPTEDSTNAVASGGVYAGLTDKIDKSSTGYETITGNPLEFDSPSPQIVGMKCDIEPSQDLHGYDKPWAGGEGKNKLPLVLGDIKALNTSGTWNDNVYTFNNVTFEVIADDNEYVTEIRANGTATYNIVYFQLAQNISVDSPLIFSTGYTDNWNTNGHVMELRVDSTTYSPYDVSGVEIPAGTYDLLGIAVAEGATVNNNYKPMLRLTTVSDYSFAPYSNICPISGVDTIDIDVEGKNIGQPPQAGVYDSINHQLQPSNSYAYSKAIVVGNAQYTVSIEHLGNISDVIFLDDSENYISEVSFSTQPVTITTPPNCRCIIAETGGSIVPITPETIGNVQIEVGSTATEYEPYVVGETYTIDLDGTRYGGQLDVTSGVLTLTYGYYKVTNDTEILANPSGWNPYYPSYYLNVQPLIIPDNTIIAVISNMMQGVTREQIQGLDSIYVCSMARAGSEIDFTSDVDNASDVKQFLIDNDCEFCYKLATPQTIQLTPTQVWAVQGGNTITVSVDGVEAEIHSSTYATLKDINDLWDYIKQSPQGSDGVRFGASNLEMIGGTMA